MNGSLETKPSRGTFVKSPDFNKKILVVDDESAILQTLRFNLERSGYAVVTASDGRSAVAMAQRESPYLIVLDIMLPVLDGIEACKEIRKFSSVPIIMLTAKDQEIDKVLALELGADVGAVIAMFGRVTSGTGAVVKVKSPDIARSPAASADLTR